MVFELKDRKYFLLGEIWVNNNFSPFSYKIIIFGFALLCNVTNFVTIQPQTMNILGNKIVIVIVCQVCGKNMKKKENFKARKP